MPPRFSVIIPHYDDVISDEVLQQGLLCLENQTYRNFEVLLYHDGPLSRGLPDLSVFNYDIRFKATRERYNDWGHSLRDLGIKEAKGEYILHFNPDNILYRFALERINDSIENKDGRYPVIARENGTIFSGNNIVIFPIYLVGIICDGLGFRRTYDINHRFILTGNPPVKYYIDCMQLVMKTDLWRKVGGWRDKSEESDGEMYQAFVRANNGARYVDDILGEHH